MRCCDQPISASNGDKHRHYFTWSNRATVLIIHVRKETRYCTHSSRISARNGMFTRPPGNDSWLGRLLKLYKVLGEGEGDLQKTAVLDIHIKFSLSNLKSVADSVCMFGPRWFKLLKGAQSLINPSLQSEFHLLPACQSSCLRLLSLFCIAEFRSVVYWHLGLFIARRWWREQGWRSPQPFQVWW